MGVSTALVNATLQKGLSERYDSNHRVELFRIGMSIGGSSMFWQYTTYMRWDYTLYNASFSAGRDNNWPPGNYSGSPSTSNTTEGADAYENTYIFPYGRYKNGDNYIINTTLTWRNYWIEGSHYFIGTYKGHYGSTTTGNDYTIRFDYWYYTIKQAYSPPYYYRNTLAIDDIGISGDLDFNDFVIRADGDCFFNGSLTKSIAITKVPTTENVTLVGAANEDWAMYDIDDFNFVINKATQITFVTTRSANYCTKILLVKDSSNYKILLSPSSNPTMYTFTGNPGTYKIGIRRSTSSNPSNCVSATYESSTAPRIWVQNNDPHLGSN